ncbi:hypothetical protein AMATHDRAFT_51451 [Amanita thiersii Skay4041]|uniref:Hydrophobin n=1 Tax=Amanita thiersii Skay4041 TaxID=703135 RepID=A0A2A9N818_9AGAR|nr:hypothetical protein AMATHDRAFT_51451 [Amanita thiersii Skay4041]
MHATSFILLALPFFASTAAAAANAMKRGGQCSSGSAQCCKTTEKSTVPPSTSLEAPVPAKQFAAPTATTYVQSFPSPFILFYSSLTFGWFIQGGLINTGCTVVQL